MQKEKKSFKKPTKLFPNECKRKLAKFDKGSCYNLRKWINKHEYEKGRYYSEYYDDDLDLITTDENSGIESQN